MIDSDLRNELLMQGTVEFMDLRWINQVSRSVLRDESEVIPITVTVIRSLLDDELAVAGELQRDANGLLEVRPWGLSAAEAADRIEREWRELKRPLDYADIVWLDLTAVGKQTGKELLKRTKP